MTVSIRPITEKDIESFHTAVDFVAREKRYLAFLQAPPLESTRDFVRGNIAKDRPQFIADLTGKVVGWCDIMPHESRETIRHTGTLGMGLLPEYRGQGIGTRLMTATIDKAKQKGLTRIELTVREGNAPAIALYKKMGFEMEGTKRKAHYADGIYENIHMMALLV